MKTNFDKINPKKVLGYLMASALVFFAGSVTAQTNYDVLIDSQTNTFTPASLTSMRTRRRRRRRRPSRR
jgi:hypothetical protein